MLAIIIIVISLVMMDQITKIIVTRSLEISESISLIDNFLAITYHRNAGAAWGILQGQMIFFYTITIIVIGVLIFWLRKIDLQKERLLGIAIAFMLGGAVGNFIDRLLYQEVIDFIDVMILGYDFPIFNIADSALCIGVFLFAIDAFYLERKRKKRAKSLELRTETGEAL